MILLTWSDNFAVFENKNYLSTVFIDKTRNKYNADYINTTILDFRPSYYRFKIQKSYSIYLSQSYNPWRCLYSENEFKRYSGLYKCKKYSNSVDGKPFLNMWRYDNAFEAWNYIIYFRPQSWFYVWLMISWATLVVILWLLWWYSIRKPKQSLTLD